MQHVFCVTHDRRQQRLDGVLYIPTFAQAPPPPLRRYHSEPSVTAPVAWHSLNDFPGLLQGARQLEVLARFAKDGDRDKLAEERLQALAEVVADGQHHDAITGRITFFASTFPISSSSKAGTSMQHVVYDLHKRLATSAAATFEAAVAPALSTLLSLYPPSPLQHCPLLNASICHPSSSSPSAFTLILYNPLKRSQSMRVRVPVSMSRLVVKREGGGDVLAALMPCWWCEQQQHMLLHVVADVEGMTSVVMSVIDVAEQIHDNHVTGAVVAAVGAKAVATETMTNGIISIEFSLNPPSPFFFRNIDTNVRPPSPRPKEYAQIASATTFTNPTPQVTTDLRFDWFHYNSTDPYSGAYLFR
jgi:hypothetical protein